MLLEFQHRKNVETDKFKKMLDSREVADKSYGKFITAYFNKNKITLIRLRKVPL